jgi:cephalosporin hydroxylase
MLSGDVLRANTQIKHGIEDYQMNLERLARGCVLPQGLLRGIQNGTMHYKYKDVPTYKSPFDLALYQLLLWEQKPRTLFEIGSKWGGSALWFADVLKNYGIDYSIHSIDIEQLDRPEIPRVTFYRGDGRNLSATFPLEFLQRMPRPIMVIEDADHRPATTLSVLRFFDNWLKPGEYIVIEDGIVDDLFKDSSVMAALDGGPRPAITEFLRDRGSGYEIDTRLCDYFGANLTWNVNGYLRRLS